MRGIQRTSRHQNKIQPFNNENTARHSNKKLLGRKNYTTRADQTEVTFTTPFKQRPYVMLSLEKIDEGQFIEESVYTKDNQKIYHTVNRVSISAQNISNTGFILNIETWDFNIIYGYRITWTAISED